jgi:hypothetical protein
LYDPNWWKSQPIQAVVMDGGIDYFRVIYDLSAKRFTWYDENISP